MACLNISAVTSTPQDAIVLCPCWLRHLTVLIECDMTERMKQKTPDKKKMIQNTKHIKVSLNASEKIASNEYISYGPHNTLGARI